VQKLAHNVLVIIINEVKIIIDAFNSFLITYKYNDCYSQRCCVQVCLCRYILRVYTDWTS